MFTSFIKVLSTTAVFGLSMFAAVLGDPFEERVAFYRQEQINAMEAEIARLEAPQNPALSLDQEIDKLRGEMSNDYMWWQVGRGIFALAATLLMIFIPVAVYMAVEYKIRSMDRTLRKAQYALNMLQEEYTRTRQETDNILHYRPHEPGEWQQPQRRVGR